jgi:hypothetical protein
LSRFNQRNWNGLRGVLADNVKLHQSLHPPRVGRADVRLFFTLYAKIDGAWLAPARLEGREVIAVFEDRADPKPSYIMWLEWRNGRISFIHDYRYDGVDGAPNGIIVPRWSLSSTHLKGSRPWASLSGI